MQFVKVAFGVHAGNVFWSFIASIVPGTRTVRHSSAGRDFRGDDSVEKRSLARRIHQLRA